MRIKMFSPINTTVLCTCGLLVALVFALPTPTFAQSCGTATGLNDFFTNWTTNSDLLNMLAQQSSNPPGTFVTPIIGYGQSGLQMGGTSQDYQFTGMQSVRSFSAPFTLSVYAVPVQGNGNPVNIFLVKGDLSQYLAVSVNFSPTYDGIWANATNLDPLTSLGEQFGPPILPAYNTLYQFTITVDSSGMATVTVISEGNMLGTLSSLPTGTGPFYIVLGQRIGLAPSGSQTAIYRSVELGT